MQHLAEKKIQFIIIIIVFALQYLAEHVLPQASKNNSGKNELRNIGIGIMNMLLLYFPARLIVELFAFIQTNQIGIFQYLQLPFYVEIAGTIIIMDIAMYWWHRFNHTFRFFWRWHKFHHQDLKMNTTTAFRFHIVELILSNVFKALLFTTMGFMFVPVLVYEIIFFIAVMLHHSNIFITREIDMVYRKVFSSPLMHRIHHSDTREETDTNYGSVFSFWDRLFKTYKKDAAGPIVFGVKD